MRILSYRLPLLRARNQLTSEEVADTAFVVRRVRAIDCYVLVCLLIEVSALCVSCQKGMLGTLIQWIVQSFAVLRIVEILQVTVNASIFDALKGAIGHRIASVERMIVLAAVNFVELLLCFGVVYASHKDYLKLNGDGVSTASDALYFSAITQLTIGYGDVLPDGPLRVVAPIQGLVAFAFVVLVFSRFVASMRPMQAVFDNSSPEADTAIAAHRIATGTEIHPIRASHVAAAVPSDHAAVSAPSVNGSMWLESGARVSIVLVDRGFVKVQVLSGPLTGTRGWIPAQCVTQGPAVS
jgi:hypothetical protein